MVRLLYWCFQATHRQDSPWSWVVCICAACAQMIHMGILRSFGVMFPVLMKEFQTSREKTAWVSSLALSLSLFAAPAVGHVSDRFGCRPVMLTGGLFCIVGLLASSFVNSIELLYLTFGILMGLGACCCRTMCFLIVAKYFLKRRAFATGCVTMGPSLGMFVLAPTTQAILDAVGWRQTFGILAAVSSLLIVLSFAFNSNVEEEDSNFAKSNTEGDNEQSQSKKGNVKLLDLSVWKSPYYCILVTSFSVMFLCRFIPNVHLVKYSEELNIPADKAAHFLMYLGICSAAARVLIGRFSDFRCVNVRYINQFAIVVAGVATLLLPLARTYGLVALYTVVFSFADGAFMISENVILLSIFEPERRAAAFGFGTSVGSLALAGGPPIAGVIADKLGSYVFAFYAAGCMMLFGAAIQLPLHCLKSAESKQSSREVITMEESDEVAPQPEDTCHKEYLAKLYVSTLT